MTPEQEQMIHRDQDARRRLEVHGADTPYGKAVRQLDMALAALDEARAETRQKTCPYLHTYPLQRAEHTESSRPEGNCELCGKPLPPGEEMFRYHGYSGPCPEFALHEYHQHMAEADMVASNSELRCQQAERERDEARAERDALRADVRLEQSRTAWWRDQYDALKAEVDRLREELATSYTKDVAWVKHSGDIATRDGVTIMRTEVWDQLVHERATLRKSLGELLDSKHDPDHTTREDHSACKAHEQAWREAWEKLRGIVIRVTETAENDHGFDHAPAVIETAFYLRDQMTALQPKERATDTHQADVPQTGA